MEFDWSPISPENWRALLVNAPRANLLQSWPYAVAARMHDQMMSRRAAILEAGAVVGVIQVQEVQLGPVHVVKLHRGPLWLEGEPEMLRWRAFLPAFEHAFPKRIGRFRQFLPELPDSVETRAMLADAGLRLKNPERYQTILLDLRPPLAEIRRRLRGKWRNALSQAERGGSETVRGEGGHMAVRFLKAYAADKAARRYRGPTAARLGTMIAAAARSGDVFVLNAVKDGETLAAILIFRHGASATYQAGWTTPEGRATRAHHLLLWHAVAQLKHDGAAALDLGGIHHRLAEGVTRFKTGLGGAALTLPGIHG